MGVLFAFIELLSWGLGDFLIQRSARKFGDWIALFYITAFGAIVLFPFIYRDLINSFDKHLFLLCGASILLLFVALLDFEALRTGKISVIEPIYALEIPVTTLLAAYIIKERLDVGQSLLIISLMLGIFLVSTRSFSRFKNINLEKGIWCAFFATVGMGAVNFIFGVGSRTINPLMINWFTDSFIAVVSLIYLASNSRLKEVAADFKNNKRLILNVSFFDKLAWITFSYATLYVPIAIATGISEGYIAFAGGLGLLFNKEKLKHHQLFGFFLAIVSVIALAIITDK